MNKKELQRERIRRYFIDATTAIIKSQGPAHISVRKVADAAGYSYATIYNYFSDLNDLLWHAALDFIEEMAQVLSQIRKPGDDPVDVLKNGYRAYVNYYLENPSVFFFLFRSQLGPPPEEVEERLQSSILGKQQALVLQECVSHSIIAEHDQVPVGEILHDMVHGLLLMYFAARRELSQQELFRRLDTNIDFIMQCTHRG